MKFATGSKSLILGLAVLLATSAFAANKAGAKPNAQVAMAERTRAKPRTKLSTRMAFTRGKFAGRSELSRTFAVEHI